MDPNNPLKDEPTKPKADSTDLSEEKEIKPDPSPAKPEAESDDIPF